MTELPRGNVPKTCIKIPQPFTPMVKQILLFRNIYSTPIESSSAVKKEKGSVCTFTGYLTYACKNSFVLGKFCL